jgi:hypothetical protein
VVANVIERSAVSKQAAKKFYVKRFNLKKLSKWEVRKHYRIKNSNKFAALENLNDSEDIKYGLGEHEREYQNLKQGESRSVRIEAA